MKYEITLKQVLPQINVSNNFIIDENAYETLAEDWIAFITLVLDIAFDEKKGKFKTFRATIKERKPFLSMKEKSKNILGLGKEFPVIDIDMTTNGSLVPIALLSYEDLIEMYYHEGSVTLSGVMSRMALIDKFFGYLWSKKKLLYPINNMPGRYQRPEDWNEVINETPLAQMVGEWFDKKTNASKTVMYRKNAINKVFSSTRWYAPEQITDKELTLMQKAIGGEFGTPIYKRRSDEFDVLVINEIRFMLIDSGRDDIRKPRDIAQEKKARYNDEGELLNRFKSLHLDEYPNFITLQKFYEEYIQGLKDEGHAVGSIQGQVSTLNNFTSYMIEHFPNKELSTGLVNEMFNPKSEKNLYVYLQKVRNSKESAFSELKSMVRFFAYSDIYSSFAEKNTPAFKRKTKREPHRDAMPKEMVSHVVDILKNRPPNSPTKWDKNKADYSWWKFDVYPVYPLMMLFGYFIPVRGGQIRWLCRDNSFVFDKFNKIETIVINTDKNVNRKYLHEIPCVWEDLQIFVPFLKWHKEYFKNIPKVKYKNDDNSPWADITPLMTTPKGLNPISQSTHNEYHKKVLCQYQIEKTEEAKSSGDKDFPIVAWRDDGEPFFKDVEALNNAKTSEMKKINIAYDLHSLRVTGATRYLEAGLGLNMVMDLTGHTSVETLTRIYIRLTKEEKEKSLKSAIDHIYFGDSSTLMESTSGLLKGEFARAYDKGADSLEKAFSDNKLSSFYRKDSINDTSNKRESGIEVSLSKHPSTWRPMIHGICPSVKCPEGRENKCSLCPYLITGKLFVNGITHQLNNTFARFQRESLELEREKKENSYDNHAKTEGLETVLEEILGWQEILTKISIDISEDCVDPDSPKSIKPALIQKQSKKVFGLEKIDTELAYLKNAYGAEIIGVEKDIFGMKVLTIKAMKVAAELGDMKMLDSVSNDEKRALDLLMGFYTNKLENKEEVSEFINSIGASPKKIT